LGLQRSVAGLGRTDKMGLQFKFTGKKLMEQAKKH
jgi:hypothetical protein